MITHHLGPGSCWCLARASRVHANSTHTWSAIIVPMMQLSHLQGEGGAHLHQHTRTQPEPCMCQAWVHRTSSGVLLHCAAANGHPNMAAGSGHPQHTHSPQICARPVPRNTNGGGSGADLCLHRATEIITMKANHGTPHGVMQTHTNRQQSHTHTYASSTHTHTHTLGGLEAQLILDHPSGAGHRHRKAHDHLRTQASRHSACSHCYDKADPPLCLAHITNHGLCVRL